MKKETNDLLKRVATYYSDKLAEHGESPQGVDWNGAESQAIRFKQLSGIIKQKHKFSINDLGCGYGALYEYLRPHHSDFHYHGYDVSPDMVNAAHKRFEGNPNTSFSVTNEPTQLADYGIASGIFNVRMGYSDSQWIEYMKKTLDILDKTSRRGFSFNCLTSYSDSDKMRDYLYYADGCALFDHCKRHYARNVALLHDYGLFEFTILVRKTT